MKTIWERWYLLILIAQFLSWKLCQEIMHWDCLRPVLVEFHGEFHCIKYTDMPKRENVRVSWDVRRISSPWNSTGTVTTHLVLVFSLGNCVYETCTKTVLDVCCSVVYSICKGRHTFLFPVVIRVPKTVGSPVPTVQKPAGKPVKPTCSLRFRPVPPGTDRTGPVPTGFANPGCNNYGVNLSRNPELPYALHFHIKMLYLTVQLILLQYVLEAIRY
jgi:hypothetical protein